MHALSYVDYAKCNYIDQIVWHERFVVLVERRPPIGTTDRPEGPDEEWVILRETMPYKLMALKLLRQRAD